MAGNGLTYAATDATSAAQAIRKSGRIDGEKAWEMLHRAKYPGSVADEAPTVNGGSDQ